VRKIEDQGSGLVAPEAVVPSPAPAANPAPVPSDHGSREDSYYDTPLITPPMLRNIQRLFTAAGVKTAHERHQWETNLTGRGVYSTNDLTIKEGIALIDNLIEVTQDAS
jgi:hypothetical protein